MDRCATFRELHVEGIFIIPNPWDIGSAVRLAQLGFPALATTSSGFAWSIGKQDQQVTLDELLPHVEALAAAVDVPLNVDAERCYADDAAGVARTVDLLAAAGAAGLSIEDFDPATGAIDALEVAVDRVAAAAAAASRHGLVLTARTERHLYGAADLEETIVRLCAYRDAGAEVLYAPGLVDLDQIAAVVRAVERPINVLKLPAVPDVAALASVGVRRVSTGGGLARAAYSAMHHAAKDLWPSSPNEPSAVGRGLRDSPAPTGFEAVQLGVEEIELAALVVVEVHGDVGAEVRAAGDADHTAEQHHRHLDGLHRDHDALVDHEPQRLAVAEQRTAARDVDDVHRGRHGLGHVGQARREAHPSARVNPSFHGRYCAPVVTERDTAIR